MTITTPDVGLTPSPPRLGPIAPPPSAWRRGAHAVSSFARRSPMSVVWGLIAHELWIVLFGLAVQTAGKLWFLDRMALLYDDMAPVQPDAASDGDR